MKKDFIIYSSVNNNTHESKHSKILPSEDLNNISTFNTNTHMNDHLNNEKFYKKIETKKINNNKNENIKKDNNKIYDYKKRCWIINLTKDKNRTSGEHKYKRHHTTLLEILQKRMNSESGKEFKNSSKFYKTTLPEKRIKNNNIIKRRKEFRIEELKDKFNSNNDNSIIKNIGKNIYSQKNNREEKDKEDKNDKKKLNEKNINNIIKNDNIKNDKRNIIKLKINKKISPFISEIRLYLFLCLSITLLF